MRCWKLRLGLLGGLALVLAACGRLGTGDAPTFEEVRSAHTSSESTLLDRNGCVIHELRTDPAARRLPWTELADVSPALVAAILRAEDRKFYLHRGIDWRAVAAAAWSSLSDGPRRGASTITMQLASLLDSTLRPGARERGFRQKWRQMQAARRLETGWTKGQILEAYLNLATFRGELQGVSAASSGLFGKVPSGLDEAESAVLAVLLRSPGAQAEAVVRRACALVRSSERAPSRGNVASVAEAALGKPPLVRSATALAPHVARRLLKPGVRQCATTLDADLQRFTKEALQRALASLEEQDVRDGAALAVDNETGEILAYVGNGGRNPSATFVDGVTAPRQAGSALKPFLYELAFERRLLTAASLLEDSPVNLPTPTGLYVPQNYDRQFRGFVTARTALAASLNVPAIRVLMLAGLDDLVDRLRQLGFQRLTEPGDFYGYSLALGSAEVTLWELVNAYRALAEGGLWSPLTLVPRPAGHAPVRRMDEAAAYIVSDVLADRSARSTVFGLDNPLAPRFWSAAKTGTSKDMRDNWCVGYSRKFTVGVWFGNFDGRPMQDVSGVSGAAPLWLEMMDYLHEGRAAARPEPPRGVLCREVRFCPAVEPPRQEWFITGTETALVELRTDPAGRPRVAYPAEGVVIAIDADIPADLQRVFFRMDPPNPELRWRLDGEPVDDPSKGWQPRQGRHTLELVTQESGAVDTVSFLVRGGSL